MSDNLLTLGRHLRIEKDLGALVDVIEAIALAGKAIAHRVRRARIDDVIGEAGAVNVQGEAQQKLDVLSDQLLLVVRDGKLLGTVDPRALVSVLRRAETEERGAPEP